MSSGTQAAAHGGYTTVCAMPNLDPVPDSLPHLEQQLALIRRDAAIRVLPYGSITRGQLGEELSDMAAMAPYVAAFSDDGRGVQSEAQMRLAMETAKGLHKLIVAHCEDNSLLHGGYIHDGAYARTHGHRGICSESEWGQIRRDLELVRQTGCGYHVCHISTKESVALIRRAKAEGLDVTCETAPHYLLMDETMLQEDGRFKMNPPLRSPADREALLEGLADGTIDMIATDHAPHSAEEKGRGLEKSTTTNDLYAYTMYVTPVATPTVFSNGMLAIPQESGSVNPYNMLNNTGYRRYNTMVAQSLLSLTQDFSDIITPGLKANVKFAWDAQNATLLERAMSPVTYYATGRDENGELMLTAANPNGSNYMRLATSDSSGTTAINFEGSLIYERLFAEDHRVSGMFLYSVRSKSKNRPLNYIDAYPTKNMGIAGRFTYAFRDKYFAEFNFGYNGSENFAPGKRYGFFPSYAVGYMISNEKFWEPLRDKINILKIRASYGKIGNDEIGGSRRFAYNTTMNTNAGGFLFGDLGQTSLPGYSTGEYGNPDVAWEEATKADVGIELGLFNKIKIQADYFYEKREGIFIQRESTPSVVGTKTAQWVNLGRMKNQGFDMSLEFDHSFNKDFSISARGNFTYNRNKKLYDDKPDQIWKYQNLAGFANNQQFGLIAEGLFESEEDIANWPKQDFGTVRPGDIKYRDVNGDGVVNTFDKVAIGYTLVPEINYGFGASLKWKGIDVSVFFSGVGHVTRIIQGQNLFGASSTILRMGQIFEDVAKNRWTLDNQNPNAPYPRLSLNKVDNNQQLSTYWQRDMSFLRLKDAEIGYTLPESMTKKWGLSKIRFYIQGKNLVTFSDFKLWDPEVNANYGNVYPLIRTFAIGANVNF